MANDERETRIVEPIDSAVAGAFNAGYSIGRKDGAKYGVDPKGDAPDCPTRRREWIKCTI